MGSERQSRVKDDPEGFGLGNHKGGVTEIRRDGEKRRFGRRSSRSALFSMRTRRY